MSDRPPCCLPPAEHIRQLQHVYGDLSPAFVAEELLCTLDVAAEHLYGGRAAQHSWVRLTDLASVAEVPLASLKRWMRRHHVPLIQNGRRGRTAALLVHLDDALRYLALHRPRSPWRDFPNVDYLPRTALDDLPAIQEGLTSRAPAVDVDWHLARRAAWPMTAERLADAVFGSRSADAQRQARKMLRVWERQGRVVCYARGLYDLIRPALVLDPAAYHGRPLRLAETRLLRTNHPELAHWSSAALGAAWRAYSTLYGGQLLPVLDRAEPTLLEYLVVRQVRPDRADLRLDGQYEELCREAALYRLSPAPAAQGDQAPATAANIDADLTDEAPVVRPRRTAPGTRNGRGSPA